MLVMEFSTSVKNNNKKNCIETPKESKKKEHNSEHHVKSA
jgi:hypothetical protein